MRERPIIFSAGMVRAVLSGNKTQTRRIIKPQPPHAEWTRVKEYSEGMTEVQPGYWMRSKYGVAGDRLWVRETWAVGRCSDCFSPRELDPKTWRNRMWYQASYWNPPSKRPVSSRGRTRASIHMPRWASRITLEITGVRVERLQDISEEDAKAEGVEAVNPYPINVLQLEEKSYVSAYRTLWESINGVGGWDKNPWVWVIDFEISLRPLSESDFQLALALRKIQKRYGSLAAFYNHLEVEQKEKARQRCKEQAKTLAEASL